MINNPLINLRWLLVQRTVDDPARLEGFADGTADGSELPARLADILPVLESAPGADENAASLMRAVIYEARNYRLIVRFQIAELVLAYVTVQLLHFMQRDSELTESERRFAKTDLASLMEDALTLLRTDSQDAAG